MITSFTLLAPEECRRIEDALTELRAHWIPRGPAGTSFFTLGAASYLDELPAYREHAARLNPVLRDGFGWLYERVFEFLGKRLRAPVEPADGMGWPGFHVWLAPAIFVRPQASVHFDLQYERTWPDRGEGVDYTRPLSFTLPIRLPRRGGGLNVWDLDYARFRAFSDKVGPGVRASDLTMVLDRLRHPYSAGALAMHSGHLLHQIGEIDEVEPDDQRITLQGHGLFQRGAWRVYW